MLDVICYLTFSSALDIFPLGQMSSETLTPFTTFAGRYRVESCIGRGGMGAVYEVVHLGTLRRRALKVLLPSLITDADARSRFAQEASITAGIDSEHLVEVFDAGVDATSGCPFIVMELLKGESLGERLARRQRHEPSDVVEILRQVALVLEQTHRRGIIHRDLKPDNLFLARREDGSVRVKVLDFGIAKMLERGTLSRNTTNIGTPLYMAPEQLDGSALGPATDLFALTHIAFELLTGESYWEPELRKAPSSMVLLRWIDRGLPEPPRVRAERLGVRVGPGVDAWFAKGTARSPQDRFTSARELGEAFASALDLPLASIEVGRISLTGLWMPRRESDAALDDPTVPRERASDHRTHAGLVTPHPDPAAPSAGARPLLVAMGVGVALAAVVGAALLVIATRRRRPSRSRRLHRARGRRRRARPRRPTRARPERRAAPPRPPRRRPLGERRHGPPNLPPKPPVAVPRSRDPAQARARAACRKDPTRCRE